MKQVLYCSKCGNALSRPVKAIDGAESQLPSGRGRIGTDMLLEGETYLSYKRYWDSAKRDAAETDKVPQYWLSLSDILDEALVKDQTTFVCCGLDGMYNWNVKCRNCGRDVGSELSDCMIANFFIANPVNTMMYKAGLTSEDKLQFYRLQRPVKRHTK